MKKGPLYFVVKEDIKSTIESGELKPGDVLATENELCQKYNVSRVTVRRAISELVSDQVLERGFGKSALVSRKAVPRSLNRLTGLFEELKSQGIKCSSYVLSTKVVAADKELAAKIGLEEQVKLRQIERLRYADGDPLCYQNMYIPEEMCVNLDTSKLVNNSLYYLLEADCGVSIASAEQTITSVMSGMRIAALLELHEDSPMLKTVRHAYDKDKHCVEYSESFYVGSRYKLNMTMER